MYIKAILKINELKTTAAFTPIVLKTVIPINSLIPSPEMPIGNANNMIIDNNVKTKKTFIKSIYCPNDKNNKKNNNASRKFFTKVINMLYTK